ncbi:uncharacterized protein PFL1_01542 [Pseudozyma flocculosa PF-1]|nr:uncharacterized protein PFL1_01542 [Pseudozyma flocculosa PF-1]EPQ30641.1 hypothetical protein PFL1_01542 [Pseudozyma flocculosa PF-1]
MSSSSMDPPDAPSAALRRLSLREDRDATVMSDPPDSDGQMRQLRDLATQHLEKATTEVQTRINIRRLLINLSTDAELLALAEKGLRTSIRGWVDGCLGLDERVHLPSWLTGPLKSDGLQHLLDDPGALTRIIGSEPTLTSDTLTEEATVALLHRTLIAGASHASPPRPRPGVGLVRLDFEDEFYGEADDDLCYHIDTVLSLYDERLHYGRIVPVIQSSGSGKSRTVDQVLKRRRLGMLLCFRITKGDTDAIPARDEAAADLLVSGGKLPYPVRDIDVADRLVVLAWFEAFAHHMAEEIKAYCSDLDSTSVRSETVVRDFYDHLNNTELPTSPISAGSQASSDNAPRRQGLLATVAERYHENLVKLRPGNTEGANAFQGGPCVQAFRSLQAAVIQAYSIGEGRPNGVFILALDEAGTLGDLLSHIRRLWHAMGESQHANADRLVLLLLDTNSSIHALVGEGATLRSTRLHNKELSLLPMFNKLPFDVALSALDPQAHDPHGKTWSALLEQLALMGRPLLNNRHFWHHMDRDHGFTGLKPFVGRVSLFKVKGKLLSERKHVWLPDLQSDKELPAEQSATYIDKYMAALCQRLPLLFIGAQGSVDLSEFLQRQISSHLRTIAGLDLDTSFIITGTPSEPILSIAASDLFRQQVQQSGGVVKVWRDALWAMRHSRISYGLSTGADGEEVARILLAMATDFAAVERIRRTSLANPGSDSFTLQSLWEEKGTLDPLPVWDWLAELFGDPRAIPDVSGAQGGYRGSLASGERAASGFESFARSARISFTHFVKMPHTFDKVSKKQLAEWFVEHVAICGADTQPSWDLLIPIYVDEGWKGDATVFDVSKMSYIVVQVRNRRNAVGQGQTFIVPPAVYHRGPNSDDSGKTEDGHHLVSDLEYISLFIQLKAKPPEDAAPVRYTLKGRAPVRAHDVQAISLDGGFATILSKLGDQGAADLRALLGVFKDTNVFESALDWQARRRSLCDAQLSLYARSRQRSGDEHYPIL